MDSFSNHFISNDESEAISFELSILNTADSTTVVCEEDFEYKCKVQYRLRYTPQLFDISPSNVYLDQTLNFRLNAMGAHSSNIMREDADPVDFIKLSGTRCDSEGYFTSGDRLNSYTVSNL